MSYPRFRPLPSSCLTSPRGSGTSIRTSPAVVTEHSSLAQGYKTGVRRCVDADLARECMLTGRRAVGFAVACVSQGSQPHLFEARGG